MAAWVPPQPIPGLAVRAPRVPPQPGQVVIAYEVLEPKTGCCQCDDLSTGGIIAIVIIVLIFWPLACIPCCIPSCYNKTQAPVYGNPPEGYDRAPPQQAAGFTPGGTTGGYAQVGHVPNSMYANPTQFPGYNTPAPPPGGYGGPQGGYAPPPPAYGTPYGGYAAPPPGYGAPPPGYGEAPQTGYPAVPQQSAPASQVAPSAPAPPHHALAPAKQ